MSREGLVQMKGLPSRRAVLGAGATLLGLAVAPLRAAPAADPLASRFGGPFTLTAPDGSRVSDADFRGRFMLVYFGYTTCPDVCPVDLHTIGVALDRLGSRAEAIQPLFVTVDPERDTADRLGPYAGAFHPRLIGLTGSEAEIAAAARAYRVHRRKVLLGASDALGYLVDHSSLTYLMGRDGGFVTMFPTGTTPDRMAEVLARHIG